MTEHAFYGKDFTYDSSQGEFVSTKHKRIAEIINDYDPNLFLMAIPKRDRTEADTMPYCLGFKREDGSIEEIMLLAEDEINEHLIARIWTVDSRRNDPMAYLEKLEAAQEAIRMQEQMEKIEEAKDMAAFMIRSPLHTINMGNGRKVRT